MCIRDSWRNVSQTKLLTTDDKYLGRKFSIAPGSAFYAHLHLVFFKYKKVH